MLEEEFPYCNIGIENHVNYIHRPDGNLSVYEALGIATILNTTRVDDYFRSLNGNTQVNATDIRNLPLPSMEAILDIGKITFQAYMKKDEIHFDNIVDQVLGQF